MKIKNLIQTCWACPTIFEWDDENGVHHYFRLRHGYARIENEDENETLISGKMGGDFDGVCDFDDVVEWAENKGLTLIQE